TPSSLTTVCTAEVMSADLISSGVHVGCAALTSAATPAACGLDIDVPAIAWNRLPEGPFVMPVGCGVMPARTWMPGAVTSGLIQSPVGPREENVAMTSACAGAGVPCSQVARTPVWLLTNESSAVSGPSTWIA